MLRLIALLSFLIVTDAASAQSQPCPARLFVSGYFSTVHIFDACTGAYVQNLDPTGRIRGAQAVKSGPDGLIYVTSEKSQQILRYRNDTLAFVDVFATINGADPTGFAFGPDGNVYVAAFRSNDVRRLSATGVAIDVPVPKGTAGLSGPDNGITFGPDGNLYIPGYNSSNLIRFDPRTGLTSVAVAPKAMGLNSTRGILAERDGSGLLITGEGSGQLLRLDLASGAVSVRATGFTRPTGLDFAPNGDLLVVDGNSVVRLDPVTGTSRGTMVASGAGGVEGGTYVAVIPFVASPSAPVPVVEYYHAGLDHYFISALPADIAALDSGALKGWARTGKAFKAYAEPVSGTNPVCRFYLPPANGDSHFYSASPIECAEVRSKFPSFVFEAPGVMYVGLPDPVTGACKAGEVTVFRLWNNRADSNHRYTTDVAVKAAMLAKGYIAEGYGPDNSIMCAPA
jgi:DNA-binding beta-propeller fold protein YncE